MPGNLHSKNVMPDIGEFRAHPYCHTDFLCRYLKLRQERTEFTVGVSDSSCTEPEQQKQNSFTLSNYWAVSELAGARGCTALFTALFPSYSAVSQKLALSTFYVQFTLCTILANGNFN